MDKYTVKLYARAYQDLEEIYSYIANSVLEPDTALNMVDALETAILSLAQFPERGAIRRVGAYSNKDYRQLFLKNYTIVYRIVKQKKRSTCHYNTLYSQVFIALQVTFRSD